MLVLRVPAPSAQLDAGTGAMKRRPQVSLARLYNELVNSLPIGMAVVHVGNPGDPSTWKLAAANQTAIRLAGASLDDYVGLRFTCDSERPESGKLQELIARAALRGRPSMRVQIRSASRNGGWKICRVVTCPLPGTSVGILFEDATRLSSTTASLIELETFLENMSDAAGAILWRAEPATLRFTFVTPGAKQILGYWTERWRGEVNFWKQHAHPDDWPIVHSGCAVAARDHGKAQFDFRMYSADGQLHWFRAYVQKTEQPGRSPELHGVMVDITEQKRTERAVRRLSATLMQTQERERKRISRDLHDSVGQYLTGIRMHLADIHGYAECAGGMQDKVSECGRLVQACMEEVRAVCYRLYPPEVEMMGLGPALRAYAKTFSTRSAIQVVADIGELPARLDHDYEIALFRIAQESLTNVQRHARTDSARLRLASEGGSVLLEIADAGVGIDAQLVKDFERGTNSHGLGLLKMRERVRDLGGKLEISSNGHGTMVRVAIPATAGGEGWSDESAQGSRSGKGQRKKQRRKQRKKEKKQASSLDQFRDALRRLST